MAHDSQRNDATAARAALLNQLSLDPTERARSASPLARWLAGAAGVIVLAMAGGWFVVSRVNATVVEVVTAAAISSADRLAPGSALDASGYVVARRQATVSSKITGKVVELSIEEGQHVEQGEIIARLDDSNARAAVQHAVAQLGQARTSYRAAELAYENRVRTFERNATQFEAGFISAQSFDNERAGHDAALTAMQVAASAIDVAEANLALQQRNLEDTIVRAPFAGIVTVKAAQQGEMVSPVSAGGGFTRTGIGTIVDMASLEVEVDVNESFINRVTPGQQVEARLNAYPDWRIPARVIAIVPTADRAKATVRVRVGLEVSDPRILPQMGVRVAFLAEQVSVSPESPDSTGVIVPPQAVTGSGDTAVVYVIRNDRLERRAVRLGSAGADGQVVTAGLAPGTRLAVGPSDVLSDGLRIRVADAAGIDTGEER